MYKAHKRWFTGDGPFAHLPVTIGGVTLPSGLDPVLRSVLEVEKFLLGVREYQRIAACSNGGHGEEE